MPSQVGKQLVQPAAILGAGGNSHYLNLLMHGQQAQQLHAGVACAPYNTHLDHDNVQFT